MAFSGYKSQRKAMAEKERKDETKTANQGRTSRGKNRGTKQKERGGRKKKQRGRPGKKNQ